MKRSEALETLNIHVPEAAKVRVIISTDIKNEADDHFSIMQHLLSPMEEVLGIVAAHFEHKTPDGNTMERSYQEGVKLLSLAGLDDVPLLRGCTGPLNGRENVPDSEGVQFIIDEARKPDPRKIYVPILGAATDVAAAILRAPDIAEKLVLMWNGGGVYPEGCFEFNLMQDIEAGRVLLECSSELWQSPRNVYSAFCVSLAELAANIRPCGAVGKYMYEQLEAENFVEYNPNFLLRAGENWTLGDNTTNAMFLMGTRRGNFDMIHAPKINDDMTYAENPDGKLIRRYNWLDVRITLADLFSKMKLVYGE